MQRDTYQQRRLEAALVRAGIATSWRQYLSDAYRSRYPASHLAHHVHALGVMIDQRTLGRWMRQAVLEIAHQALPQTNAGNKRAGGSPGHAEPSLERRPRS